MYWFGRADVAAAEAWWKRALYLDPGNQRAQECIRLIAAERGPEPVPSNNPTHAALSSSAGIAGFAEPAKDAKRVPAPPRDRDALLDIDAAAWALGRAVSDQADDKVDESDFDVDVDLDLDLPMDAPPLKAAAPPPPRRDRPRKAPTPWAE